jgi:hypothetical protein
MARQALPARAQEQAEDVALLDPLPVLGGQVLLAIAVPAGRLAGRGVRRRPVLAGAGVMDYRVPFTHDFKVPRIRWRWQIT